MNYRTKILERAGWSLLAVLLLGLPGLASAAMQHGRVHSGGKAIAGATVKLFAAGTRYGQEAELLGEAQTNPGGVFRIRYASPDQAGVVLYLISAGGTVKNDRTGVRGSALRLATVLGGEDFPRSVKINELTTVATAYTLAQFLVGDSVSGPLPGVPNAAAIFRNLVDLRRGSIGAVLANTPNGRETDTLFAFNSLANMLATCVERQASCTELFDYATPPGGGEVPTNTLQAVLNIAHYPYQNPAALFAYANGSSAYKPALDAAPDAWTLALRYAGNGKEMDGPGFVAFDEQGTAWIANNYAWKEGTADPDGVVCGAQDVLRLTPAGSDVQGPPPAPYTGGGANGAGFGILVDRYGSVWQGNFGFAGANCADKEEVLALSHSVSKYDSNGNPLSPDNMPGQPGGYSGNGTIFGPQGMSSDPLTADIWIANCRNTNAARHTVTLLQGGDQSSVKTFRPFEPVSELQKLPGFLPKPFGITVDNNQTAWVAGNNINQVVGIKADGSTVALFGKQDEEDGVAGPLREINRPMGIASDSAGGIWVANSGVVDIACGFQLEPDGSAIEGENSTYASLQAAGILDQDGNATGDYDGALASIALIRRSEGGAYTLQKFARRGGVIVPWGVALDGNDNVWVANFDGQRLSQLCGQRTATCPPGKQVVGAAISPDVTGYGFNGLVRNTGVSIDPSGNVWLTNNWLQDPVQTNPGGREVVVFLGMAKPVRTPLLGFPRSP